MSLAFLCLILAFLISEKILHDRRLKRIPIRIHVNGTRGKSSVTRQIAAAMRRSGIRTLAKTTGTAPVLILPDGSEETIPRRSPANILEQMRVVRRADRLGVQAIVVECMALDPVLQSVSEAMMIRSTVGVITNVRPDHFEVMGDSLDEIAEALSRTVPAGGVVVTGDRRYFPFFAEAASRKGSRVVLAEASEGPGKRPPDGNGLFPENVEIARSVCRLLGLDPDVVDACLDEAAPPGGRAGVYRILIGDRTVHFVDAFGANDVESTRILQERALARNMCPRPWVALFNNRGDRPLRMKSFADGLLSDFPYDQVVITGEGCRLAFRYLRGKVPGKEPIVLSGASPDGLLEELLRKLGWKECTIVGMGNEKGAGEGLAGYFRGNGSR
ncbi:MAG: capB [Deltaproteobacteria bacterium]|nr:capB [Deltaproteobacteria bacterium]